MQPEIWGPYAWNFLHIITITYPINPSEDDKHNYKTFFESLKNVLPCERCRKNFNTHLKKFPLSRDVLSSRKYLVKWLIDIHNVVNHQTGKKMLSYTEALHELKKISSKTKQESDYTLYISFIVALFIAGFLFYYYKKN
jgi:hypothetical protein